jgi:hypothetical protein
LPSRGDRRFVALYAWADKLGAGSPPQEVEVVHAFHSGGVGGVGLLGLLFR